MKRFLIAVLLLLGSLGAAFAQAPSATFCYVPNTTPPNNWQPCSATNPLQISGSISASLGGFTPSTSGARGTPFTVTTSDSSGTLPTGTVVIVSNPGANPMYCNVNGVAATTSDQPVAAGVGNWFAFTIPTGVTTLHCIATGGSTTANMLGGSGLATGSGGGGGGGGGGAITIASGGVASGAYASGAFASGAFAAGSIASGAAVDGWDVTMGAKADLAWVSGAGSLIAIAKTIANNTGGAIPAGSANIGGVEIFDSGGTNKLSVNASGAALVTGTGGTFPVTGTFWQTTQPVSLTASTTGGCSPYTPFVPTAGDNHQVIKNGAGTVCAIQISNNSATKNYARLYDAGTGFNGCNSATGVIFAFEIPPTDSGFSIPVGGANGMSFSTGLSICITSGFGLTDTTNATATAMYVNVQFK
jgi:hypothetical protein